MTPDHLDSYDRVPESLSSAQTLFRLHQKELLDAAAILRLTSDGAGRVTSAVDTIAALHDEELQQDLLTRQALLEGELAFVEEDLARRAELVPKLEANYDLRTTMRDARATVAAEIVKLEVDLLARRAREEVGRLERELQRVRQQENEVEGRTPTAPDEPAQTAADAARDREIEELKRRRDEILTAERGTFDREERIRARSITRTVSGFLLWLGYASVVATGSVLALVMSGPRGFDLSSLAVATRAFVSSILPNWPPSARLFVALALVLALLWLIARVFIESDRLLRKQWQWHERTRRDATAQMSPQALSPRTYAGVVALLPFVFVVAAIMTVLALTPTPSGDGTFLASVFPGVGYSFIGVAIAFLATAVFAMYFVHVIQPRTDGHGGVLRAGWEFTLPPLLLVSALALTPLHQDVNAARWLPWSAFMLLSSLSLACGLVYHGIFKDAKRARERLLRIDRRLQRMTGVPAEDSEDEGEQDDGIEPAALRRRVIERRMDRIAREQISRATNRAPDGSDAISAAAAPPGALVPFYRVIDVEAAPEVMRQIEERRAAMARLDSALRDLNAAIADLEALMSYDAMNSLRRRLHMLKAIKVALIPQQEERRRHSRIAKELLLLEIESTERAAAAIDPLFRAAREAGGTSVPKGATS